jgi:hypothetical protein
MDRRTVYVFVACLAVAGTMIGVWIPWNNPCLEIVWGDEPRSWAEISESPYGMPVCDYFPSDAQRYTKLGVLLGGLILPAAVVGMRAVRSRLLLGGGAIALGSVLAAAFWQWVPTYEFVPVIDRRLFTLEMLVVLGTAFGIGTLGAFLGRLAMPNKSLERTRDR